MFNKDQILKTKVKFVKVISFKKEFHRFHGFSWIFPTKQALKYTIFFNIKGYTMTKWPTVSKKAMATLKKSDLSLTSLLINFF